jgi:hypothetical protein
MVRQAHHEDLIFSLILSLSKDEVLEPTRYQKRTGLAEFFLPA